MEDMHGTSQTGRRDTKKLYRFPADQTRKVSWVAALRRAEHGRNSFNFLEANYLFNEVPTSMLVLPLIYKQKNTVKYLVAITPQGSISFISLGYGGRASDKHITEESGPLDLLLPGDQVLADRGFTVQTSAGIRYGEGVMPEFTRGKKQLQGRAVEQSRKVLHVRIHVERVIGLLRQKSVIPEGTIPLALIGSAQDKVDMIWGE
ncbi:uncharacterized protein [Syngnathus scovelli]|uniref:uncharacterized protein n=1 Tax=Syngnathus scovelli TaxID=161590 RepID=UPI0035C9F7A9